ncbi:MAG: aspartyl-phosphate phosphatase Spo0E family protein [Clostridia bacterium]|nr:aspartyl-phosphate phosphatase Spo0E family protein [Clostridia bacterium]
MAEIEALRKKLYSAMEADNSQEALMLSQELDREIVKFMRQRMKKIVLNPEDQELSKNSTNSERRCEDG